jgi:hypothetical protein
MKSTSRTMAALLILTTLLFLPLVLHGEFIWDDPKLVVLNQWTGSFSNLGKMFSSDLWASTPLGEGDFFYYRPLMLVDLAIDRHLGLGAGGHHLHSLAWHLLCVALLFRLCLEDEGIENPRKGLVLLAGLSVFALHPLQSETLAHIAARNDAMTCAGILGALLLLRDARPTTKAIWGASACIGLAIFSKETAVLAPLMLLCVDIARFGGPKNALRYGAVLFPIGLAIVLRLSLGSTSLPLPTDPSQIGDLLAGIGFYVGALVFPWDLTPAVSTDEMHLSLFPMIIGGLVLIWIGRTTTRFGRAGLGLACLGFLPAIPGLVLTENTGFRYLYLPLAGLAMALQGCFNKAPRNVLLLLPALLFGLTAKQIPHWQTDTSFWQQAYDSAPGLQSACGMFKAVEAKAIAQPNGSERDALFVSAEPWLAKSLEAPTSPYCCFSASRWMWERNQKEWNLMNPEPAITWGRLALENGCEASAELLVPLAVSEALTGQWNLAEKRVQPLQGNQYGLRSVLLSAAGLRRGDSSVLTGFSKGDPASERELQERVKTLFDANLAIQAEALTTK